MLRGLRSGNTSERHRFLGKRAPHDAVTGKLAVLVGLGHAALL
jgi:hypothetical protein